MLGFRLRSGRRARLFTIAFALLTILVAGVMACSGSSSTSVPPTTGILIRAETLTAGRGCGPGPTQLFKYAVVVFGFDPAADPDAAADRSKYTQPVASNIFDCYTDGAFISLPPSGGNSSYRLEVYAYNAPSYTASRATIDGAGTNVTSLRETTPTWTTECTATQQENVQALADCNPLGAGLAGLGGKAGVTKITLGTSRFNLPDGRIARCATASEEDAGVEAGSEAGADADIADGAADATDGDAAPQVDAGPPITFTTVRVRPRIQATVAGPTIDVPCPTAYLAEVTAEPARYEIDVALLDSAGNLVDPGAQTVCAVTSQTGATSSAVCP